MRVSYVNRLKTSTLAATNENINRPITNIIHNFLNLAFYATTDNTVITITLDNTYDIDHIAFDYHNIDTMIMRLYDNLGILLYTEIIIPEDGCNFHYFNAIEDVLTITLTLTTPAALLYLGGVSMGSYFELPNFRQSPGGELRLKDSVLKSTGGQNSGNRKFCPLTKTLNFANINYEEKNDIITYVRYVQRGIPHFIDMYPDAQDYNPPFYGNCIMSNSPVPKRRISTWEYDISLSYEECQ